MFILFSSSFLLFTEMDYIVSMNSLHLSVSITFLIFQIFKKWFTPINLKFGLGNLGYFLCEVRSKFRAVHGKAISDNCPPYLVGFIYYSFTLFYYVK